MYFPGAILMWAAFLLGLVSTVSYGLAVRREDQHLPLARQAYYGMTAAVVFASGLLMYLLVNHDYRLHYVWAYSDNTLEWFYLLSTFWAGQEGSFLLWIFFGALLGIPLIRYAREYESRVMLFYNATLLSLLVLLVKQNPFRFHEGLTAATASGLMDGQGLNPLLQNPWMVIHPPIMFVGYASLAIPFAFALAALWMKRYDEWTRASLPWVLVSVGTLGLAIMLGGYWAYETLGWGGYWGWDPVENASLVPWLATVALAHGMLLQRARNRFRRLNLVLAVFSYLLVVYATFLTRSGVLADFSVHSFVDLGITGWLIFNMLFFLSLALGLLVWRWREIPTEIGDEPFVSRTIFFVLGILLIILIGLIVVLGTSAPLISRLWGEPSQVGPAFYNSMGIWLAIGFAVILGATPFLAWRKVKEQVGNKLVIVLAVTTALLALSFVLGARTPIVLTYLGASLFCVIANIWATVEYIRAGSMRRAGGTVAHVGMGLMLLAFLTTGWMDRGQKARLSLDSPTDVMGYTMIFRDAGQFSRENSDLVVEVSGPDGRSFVMKPRMWNNRKTNQLIANPDIKSFLTQDLYVAPVEFDPGEEAPTSGTLLLTKDRPAEFREWSVTFVGFDMSRQDLVPGILTVGATIRIERPNLAPVELNPTLLSMSDGEVRAVTVDIPGTETGKLRLAGMNASSGIVRVELLGLGGGIGRTALLSKGESLAYKDLRITFDDFDMSEFDPDSGAINFGVVFNVEVGKRTVEVVPWFRGGSDAPEVTPVAVPGSGGVMLSIGRVDAEGGSVQLRVFDPQLEPQPAKPMSLVIDASTKPLIGLVWIGTLLTLLGVLMAIALRRQDIDSILVQDSE
ncbi:MAG: cytochrome c biogenesis protein CcsA [bacterium]|nr:cytochrome c biogenesis protein CcsA [bacterium]